MAGRGDETRGQRLWDQGHRLWGKGPWDTGPGATGHEHGQGPQPGLLLSQGRCPHPGLPCAGLQGAEAAGWVITRSWRGWRSHGGTCASQRDWVASGTELSLYMFHSRG